MSKLQERFDKLASKGLFDSEPLDMEPLGDIDLDLKPLDLDPIDLLEDLQKALDLPPVDVDLKPLELKLDPVQPLELEPVKELELEPPAAIEDILGVSTQNSPKK